MNPVIEGRARADQTSRKARELTHDPTAVLPVLIHGDAAFPGQGIVAETLNLQSLPGYSTGGTLHVIANNQLGFTTDPHESRSTRYASDLAKGFDVPIIHVNADDVEASIAAIRLALAYRETLRARRGGGPDRLPPLRPQRDRRAGLHAAAHVRAHQDAPAGPQALRGQARGGGRGRRRRRRVDRGGRLPVGGRRSRGAQALDRRAARDGRARARPDDEPRAAHHAPRGHAPRAQRAAPARARRLRGPPQAALLHREAPHELRGGQRDRLGARRGARLRLAARARRAGAAHRPGHRARHLQPAPRGAARPGHRRALVLAPGAARRGGALRAPQQPAVGAGLRRLRVRLQRAGAGRARALGGPVRRLRELGPGDRRPVPRVRPRQVGPDLAADAAAAPRLRGLGPRAFERPARALPPGGRRGQHPRGQLHHAGPVLPPAAPPGARLEAAAARGDDAEEPAAPSGGHLDGGGARRRRVRARDRRPALRGRRRPQPRDEARALLRQGLLRHRRARGARGGRSHRGRARGAALPVPGGRARRS